jgi:carbamoyl-phosphate synthase large subunit
MTTFLVSSAGRRGALVDILKSVALRRGGGSVVAIDASPLSAAGHLADHFETVPRVDSQDFVESVVDVVSRNAVDVIIPTIDSEIGPYAENRERFAQQGADVWAPSTESAQLTFDKWNLFNWMTEHDVPTVETFQAEDPRWRNMQGPVVAKPRSGSSSSGIRLSSSVDELPSDLPHDYIVQAKATGVELTVDFGVDRNGRFLGAVSRQRLEVRAGEVSKSVTVRNPEAERIAEALATELPGMYGVANVQLFLDPDTDRAKVIEVNPRFGGGYPLTHAAGADFITAMLESNPPRLTWEEGLTMLRYDSAVFVQPGPIIQP